LSRRGKGSFCEIFIEADFIEGGEIEGGGKRDLWSDARIEGGKSGDYVWRTPPGIWTAKGWGLDPVEHVCWQWRGALCVKEGRDSAVAEIP